jgi:hypothetical protein
VRAAGGEPVPVIRERSTVRTFSRATVGTIVGAGLALALPAAPASSAGPHVVTAGETLSGIAATDGLSADGLAAYNGISPDAYLTVGQTIEIPDASEAGVRSSSSSRPGSSGRLLGLLAPAPSRLSRCAIFGRRI